jgi:hypothetical protein
VIILMTGPTLDDEGLTRPHGATVVTGELSMNTFATVIRTANEEPLSRGLSTASVASHLIREHALDAWISKELFGFGEDPLGATARTIVSEHRAKVGGFRIYYPYGPPPTLNEQPVPEYRAVTGVWRDHEGRPLAIHQGDLGVIPEIRLRSGVGDLEAMAAAPRIEIFAMEPVDLPGIRVTSAVFHFEPAAVREVLTRMRARLLDQLENRREAIGALRSLDFETIL